MMNVFAWLKGLKGNSVVLRRPSNIHGCFLEMDISLSERTRAHTHTHRCIIKIVCSHAFNIWSKTVFCLIGGKSFP